MKYSTATIIGLIVFCSTCAPVSAELLAGAGKTEIVPPEPTHMGGFGDRMPFFEGVHDPVHARALVFDDGGTKLAVVGSDLMAFDEKLTAGVRERVARATAIPAENVLVSCTHNHSSPSWYQYESEARQDEVRSFFADRFAEAVIAAWESREPAEAGYANGEIENATRNRQQGNDFVDTQVGVLRVEKLEGREIIGVLFNFTGHPVIQGSRNLEVSAEYPGAACRTVESVLGGVAVFTQGACGDITVNRSGDPWLEIERLGRLVAGEVIKTAETIQVGQDVPLMSAYEEVPLPPKALPAPEAAARALDEAEAELAAAERDGRSREVVETVQRRIRLLRALKRQADQLASGDLERPGSYPGSVHVVRIGPVVLVGVPGELFVEYALELRRRTAELTGLDLILVGYANGYVGYIVTPRAMETGGYEASVARVTVDAGRILTERAMVLIRQHVQ